MEFFELIGPLGVIILSISTVCFATLEYLSKKVIHSQDEIIENQDRLIKLLEEALLKK